MDTTIKFVSDSTCRATHEAIGKQLDRIEETLKDITTNMAKVAVLEEHIRNINADSAKRIPKTQLFLNGIALVFTFAAVVTAILVAVFK